MDIRECTVKDSGDIAEISCNDLGYPCTKELVDRKIPALNRDRERVFVAEHEGKIVGYIHAEKYDTLYSETLVNILALAVRSSSRRLGAGRMLIAEAESWGKAIGAAAVRLNSGSTRTGAHGFYRSIGYGDEKEQIRFIKML